VFELAARNIDIGSLHLYDEQVYLLIESARDGFASAKDRGHEAVP
jgi:hypothetical protein